MTPDQPLPEFQKASRPQELPDTEPSHPDQLRGILKALETVESGLWQPLRAADLADAAGYSLFHFTRLFNHIVHHSPYDYLMRRRLSRAAHDLLNPNMTIMDIALAYQFSSHESFTRAFKRMFGAPPSQHRTTPPDPHRSLDPIREGMLQLMQSEALHIQERSLPAFTLSGMAAHIKGHEELPYPLVQQLQAASPGDPISKIPFCFLRLYPPDWHTHGLQLLAGHTLTPEAAGPTLLQRAVPPYTWASFTYSAAPGGASLLRKFIYQTWLPGSKFSLAEPIELLLMDQPPSSSSPSHSQDIEILVPLHPST